jgi:hypothetical protein
MQLHSLFFARTKKKLKAKPELLMTDSRKKCETYMLARCAGVSGGKGCGGFHEIRPAEKGAKTYKAGPIGGKNGYVTKSGWQPHT